jgi:hypothetical protein
LIGTSMSSQVRTEPYLKACSSFFCIALPLVGPFLRNHRSLSAGCCGWDQGGNQTSQQEGFHILWYHIWAVELTSMSALGIAFLGLHTGNSLLCYCRTLMTMTLPDKHTARQRPSGLTAGWFAMFLRMTPEERIVANDNSLLTILELRDA